MHTARDYYNSEDADNFYATVWGGEDIHVGLYDGPTRDIPTASRRTVEHLAGKLDLGPGTRVLDLGAGFGGAARYLADQHGCHVTCLNLSEVENTRNRELNGEHASRDLIDVVDGSFEDLPFEDNRFDVVWSQDAMLHSGDRSRVLEEAVRVLQPGGQLIFTDPMAADGVAREELLPILKRLQLDTMASPAFYDRELHRLGMRTVDFEDLTPQLPAHYQRVLGGDRTARARTARPDQRRVPRPHEARAPALGRRWPGRQPGMGRVRRTGLTGRADPDEARRPCDHADPRRALTSSSRVSVVAATRAVRSRGVPAREAPASRGCVRPRDPPSATPPPGRVRPRAACGTIDG